MNLEKIKELAFELYKNEEVALELANVIFGIRDGDYEEEFTYPMYFKSKAGNIVKFTDLDTCEVLYSENGSMTRGYVFSDSISHIDTDRGTQIAFDEERGIWDKAIVRCWDYDEGYKELIRFYDVINKCTFAADGSRDGIKYSNYEIVESPSKRMLELQKTLED